MSEQCAAIIDRLIARRHDQGMTQKELAQAASLTQSVIARLESKKAVPQLDTLVRVAAALGCALEIVPADVGLEYGK
ncbi:MAG TPA: helix-turn-helix transcriptional regulator [Candidatus Avoscillospira stercorigallinarum]|uniref:Helix-turn-helix transcriptional regulator n=1 Tax=Candidatus Avoscillospira stercorigallinarum TaxID=2840708 RepID=A0A9D0Z5E4_9FIRM|nr:helix-turn-helix transcriptional regulator [Candidatus Avoscillospira stercorigallinarum]